MLCPTCATENEPGRKFCAECGGPLAAQAASLPPLAAPTSERRLVSVLFADLVGFTTISESRDAEEVRELLSRYFDTCRRLISLYGGTVEKFIGDAVMAVWGAPTAQEDDAERAVRAALDLVTAVSALGDEVGAPELKARAGVLTGEAAVTLGAEGEGMVAGDLVNTASRIQSLAEAGSVLAGEATKRATEAAIAYEDAGSHQVKGKVEPVSLWRALRVTAGRAGARKAEGLEPPFVGRERELRLVKELLHGCIEERKAHLVSVVGIAGFGKSRLTWEFFKYVDGLAGNVWWWRGRCLAYGEGVTYWALAEMVRTRADIVEGEDPESARPKLREALAPYITDADEFDWIEPRLAHLLGRRQAQLHLDLSRVACHAGNGGAARRLRARPAGGAAGTDPGAGGGCTAVRRRDGADAARPRAARARRDSLSADRPDRGARDPRDAACTRRRPARRTRRGRAKPGPGRRRARQELPQAGARRAERIVPGTARVTPVGARPQGSAVTSGRSALARARPVRVPAGPAPSGRVRDAGSARAQAPSPRGGGLPGAELGPRRAGDRRGRRRSLPGCDRRRPARRGRSRDRRQGADDAHARGRAGRLAGRERGGAPLLRARRRTRGHAPRGGGAPRAGRRDGLDRRKRRDRARGAGTGARPVRGRRRDAPRRACLSTPRRGRVAERRARPGGRSHGAGVRSPLGRGTGRRRRGAGGPTRAPALLPRRARAGVGAGRDRPAARRAALAAGHPVSRAEHTRAQGGARARCLLGRPARAPQSRGDTLPSRPLRRGPRLLRRRPCPRAQGGTPQLGALLPGRGGLPAPHGGALAGGERPADRGAGERPPGNSDAQPPLGVHGAGGRARPSRGSRTGPCPRRPVRRVGRRAGADGLCLLQGGRPASPRPLRRSSRGCRGRDGSGRRAQLGQPVREDGICPGGRNGPGARRPRPRREIGRASCR